MVTFYFILVTTVDYVFLRCPVLPTLPDPFHVLTDFSRRASGIMESYLCLKGIQLWQYLAQLIPFLVRPMLISLGLCTMIFGTAPVFCYGLVLILPTTGRVSGVRWNIRSSYPKSWNVLSSVQMSAHFVAGYVSGLYNLGTVCYVRVLFKDVSRLTGRYGLGPKPGGLFHENDCMVLHFLYRLFLELPVACLLPTVFGATSRRTLGTFMFHLCMSLLDVVRRILYHLLHLFVYAISCVLLCFRSTTLLRLASSYHADTLLHVQRLSTTSTVPRTSSTTDPPGVFKRIITSQPHLRVADAAPFSLVRQHVHKALNLSYNLQLSHIARLYSDVRVGNSSMSSKKDTVVFPIILDTGASHSITPHRSDFIKYTKGDFGQCETVDGSAAKVGFGTVRWSLLDLDGSFVTIDVECYHIPSSSVRLLSPQAFCLEKGFPSTTYHYHGNGERFSMTTDYYKSCHLEIPIHQMSQLPVALAEIPSHPLAAFDPSGTSPFPDPSTFFSVCDETNQNLSSNAKELLLWHFRLGHMGFTRLKDHMKLRGTSIFQRIIPSSPAVANCKTKHLKCAACELAKGHRRSSNTTVTKKDDSKVGNLQQGHLRPGQCVSVDNYQSTVLGRLPSSRGPTSSTLQASQVSSSDPRRGVCGGTMFYDHATGYIEAHHQTQLNASDTIVSKKLFERNLRNMGVKVKNYHGDNGIFVSAQFKAELKKHDQQLSLSGVGAHFQNGCAKNAIKVVTETACSLMQHQFLHWPEAFSQDLWPFALDYACWLHNHTAHGKTGKMAPIELMSGVTLQNDLLQRARVWGCPVYVLSPELQDGKKIPKWEPRARRGQFLGFSLEHSSTIAIVRNLRTERLSPQFHVVLDELFSTIALDEATDNNQLWVDLFVNHRDYHGPPKEELDSQVFPFEENEEFLPSSESTDTTDAFDDDDDDPTNDDSGSISSIEEDISLPDTTEDDDRDDNVTVRRSNRVKKPNTWFQGNTWINLGQSSRTILGTAQRVSHDDVFLYHLDWDAPFSVEYSHLAAYNDAFVDPITSDIEWMHPFTLSAKANSQDFPTLKEIMSLSDPIEKEKWLESMDTELNTLKSKGTFEVISRSSVPDGEQINQTMWTFRRKRRPNGTMYKLKSRWVLRGDKQILPEDETTFAPVVDWATIRLLFTLVVSRGLKTKCIDFTAAFCQCSLPKPIYAHFPPGYTTGNSDQCLKIHKSLYGSRLAPKIWATSLAAALTGPTMKLTQSSIDRCLFHKPGLIFIHFVDDAQLIYEKEEDCALFLEQLANAGFDFGEEGEVSGYLGVDIKTQSDGSRHLSQTGIIDSILTDLGLDQSSKTSDTPAAVVVGPDKDGPALTSVPWNYRTVIGKLLYLAGNTRPDLALAVHQVARYSADPKESHGTAIKRIGRYLLKTRDKGMFIRPTDDLTLDCYADASFGGMFSVSDPNDPICAKSRYGFLITLGDVPVMWKSKLSTITCMSTFESEWLALNHSCRALIPLRLLLIEVGGALGFIPNATALVKTTIWEDNAAVCAIAGSDLPKLTPRSKTIAVKYWWFIEQLKPGVIEVRPINTKQQKADCMTKPLARDDFIRLRNMILGW